MLYDLNSKQKIKSNLRLPVFSLILYYATSCSLLTIWLVHISPVYHILSHSDTVYVGQNKIATVDDKQVLQITTSS